MPEPITILAFLAAAGCLAWLVRRKVASNPAHQNASAFNSRSPSRDRGFVARLFDRLLPGHEPGSRAAVVCDIGGAGQITPASDPQGRIGTVIEVNDPAAVPGAITEAEFHALARADLDVATMFGVVMYLDSPALERYLRSVRARLRPEGRLVIADPQYGSELARRFWSMATSWLIGTPIRYKPLAAVQAAAERCGFRLVEQRRYVGDWYVAVFAPAA